MRRAFACYCILVLLGLLPTSVFAAQHGLAMFGDLKYDSDFQHFDYVNPDAPKGGTMRFAAIGTFDSLNPFILKGISAQGVGHLFDTLMAGSKDETFSQYGLLAESVEVASDNSQVTFHLRTSARFHDGAPVTADDVVFSFNTLLTKGHPVYRTLYSDVEQAEALDTHTVRFVFKHTENRELPLILGQLPVLSKAYYTVHDFSQSSLDIPNGSGPYRIKDVKVGHYIVYERDSDYWAQDLPVNRGRYNFDILRYDYYRDATVAIEAFKAGEYDIREENISKVWATAYTDLLAAKPGQVIQETIAHEIPTGMQAFVFNTRRALFRSAQAREAISYAFDFEWTNKKLFFNAYNRTTSYFSNSIYAARGLPSEEELELLEPWRDHIPERVFTDAYLPPVSDGSGNIRPNLRTADRLLNDAGYHIVDKKRIDPHSGRPMVIEFLLSSPAFERVVAPFVRNLARLGIEGKIRVVDSAQYQKRIEQFDYDVVVYVFGQSNSPGNEQINYWHSSKADVEGSKNLIGLKHPAVDALVTHIVEAKSKSDLITATRALDRVLQWGFYVVPNWHIRTFRLLYWNRFDRPDIQPKYGLGLDSWWYAPQQHR